MSTALEAASLIMIPTSYSDGLLASVKPNDGAGDFTFSRGSNISATRVNADGNIEKGYENLLLQSNNFSTTWFNSNSTETSGQGGYDGSSDAWLISKSAAGGYIGQNISQSGVQTFSIYAKANDSDYMSVIGSAYQVFNLSNGTLGVGNAIDAKIESIGSGWYRCSMTENASITRVRIFPVEANSSSATSGSIYIQDAMLNQGLVAYPYVETTTAPVAGGILENMPRIDFSGGNQSLLLEPSRTNAWTYSEPASGANESPSNITTFAPIDMFSSIGIYGGVEFTGGVTRYQYGGGVAVNTTYSLSCYMRKDDSTAPILAASTADASGDFVFVLGGNIYTSSTLTSSDYSIELFKDDIYKVVFTYTTGASVNQSNNGIYKDDANSNVDLFVTGFQLEAGSYPTSYIPTYGVSQTRLQDLATASVTNTTSRTYFLDGKRLADEDVANPSPFYNPNDALGITFWSANRIRFRFGGGLNSYYTLAGDDFKIAISYDGTDSKVFVNGVYFTTQTLDLENLTSIVILGTNGAVSYNQTLLFPTALSDEECIALTTI